MVYFVYDVNVTEKSKSGDSTIDSSYRIVIPRDPTDNPKSDMTIAINQYLDSNNTNTKVISINNFEFIKSEDMNDINNEYDFHLEKSKDKNRILNNVKKLINI